MNKHNTLVIVTWDGISTPFNFVHFDTNPNFDLLLFDYSGATTRNCDSIINADFLLSKKTENKGQVYQEIKHYLNENKSFNYSYIGIMDDDLLFKISEFNYMLQVANLHDLHVFQPAIARDSYYSHRKCLQQPGRILTYTDWVEMMAPFYHITLFNAASPYFPLVNSGQGIDKFMMPCLQIIHDMNNTAIIHVAMIKHCRPIRSHLRLYSNGLTGDQEIELIRQKAIQLVNKDEYKQLFNAKFHRTILYEGNAVLRCYELYSLAFSNLFRNLIAKAKELTHFA